jgi:glycosyltransferase involved in cell wall biosynthesis
VLSCIIPSYRGIDPYLPKTVRSLLDNAEGQVEVIVVLDGGWCEPVNDPRVHYLHKGRNEGMREAINSGVQIARGDFLLRSDEHCAYSRGYDLILTKDCPEGHIVTPRRYFLDPVKWERMDKRPIDYEKLLIHRQYPKFTGEEWRSRAKERKDILVDETMMMQGSCWCMRKSWWDKVIVRLETEGYGPMYGDQLEMAMKTWQAGGKLMVNKNCWFAHKHRDFKRVHHYPTERALPEWKYALDKWLPYYNEVIKPRWKLQ